MNSSESFSTQMGNVIDHECVNELNELQRVMLCKFEKTNETLVNCNALSDAHYRQQSKELRRMISTLNDMHKDINSIFTRIRTIRRKVGGEIPKDEDDE